MKMDGFNLDVGMQIHIQRLREDGVTEVIPCCLTGFVEGQGLIVRPNDESDFPHLSVGTSITSRVAIGDSRYAFGCNVVSVFEQPYPHLHLSYPEEVQGVMKRGTVRYRMHKPIRLSLHVGEDIVSVTISDISSTGACLLSDTPLGKELDTLNIEFRVPFDQSLINLPCVVRYLLLEQDAGEKYYRHGVAFEFNSDEEQLQLETFIEMLINKQYAVPGLAN